MKAIIKAAGKQYLVKEGDIITVDMDLGTEIDKKIEFKEILAVGDNEMQFGNPFVDKAKVTGQIIERKKGDKVLVFKFKRRKRYHRKKGHRQPLNEVKIIKIEK
jgi:large subunit ribosomal protein L21